MNTPLVSVICLCHNQAAHIQEALQSILDQAYPNIELIIVDDASTDASQGIIQNFVKKRPEVRFILIEKNIGNCAAFNQGWRVSKGEFIIDLAADDVLLPNRVEIGIKRLKETQASVHFSDALLIDKNGDELNSHNDRFSNFIPEGDLYARLVSGYLICPTTMMFGREVLESLNGYDESLSYEDFDFWVRSSRKFSYAYSDQVLVKKRLLKNSLSNSQNKFGNSHQRSTLLVCRKALQLNQTKEEGSALRKRCWYETRQCIKRGNVGLIPGYLSIIMKTG